MPRTQYYVTEPMMAYPHGRLLRVTPDGQVQVADTGEWSRIEAPTHRPWTTVTAKAAKRHPEAPRGTS